MIVKTIEQAESWVRYQRAAIEDGGKEVGLRVLMTSSLMRQLANSGRLQQICGLPVWVDETVTEGCLKIMTGAAEQERVV